MSKSNEYGYVPTSPAQSRESNTGIFEVNDIVDLLNSEQWKLQDDLVLIETKNITTSTAFIDFTDLGSYNTHLLSLSDEAKATATKDFLCIRVGTDGTFKTSRYSSSFRYGGTNNSFGDDRSQAETSFNRMLQNTDNTGNANGIVWLYNIVNNETTVAHGLSFGTETGSSSTSYFHYGGWEQNEKTTHNQIRLFVEDGVTNFGSLNASLYGLQV